VSTLAWIVGALSFIIALLLFVIWRIVRMLGLFKYWR